MTVATWQNVQTLLVREFTTDEQTVATEMIDLYQGELEGILGVSLAVTTHVERRTMLPIEWEIALENTPVTSITSVEIDGILAEPGAYRVVPGGVEFVAELPVGADLSGLGEYSVVITYVAGANPELVPPAKSAIVARVARTMNQRADDTIGTKAVIMEGYRVQYFDEDGFTESEIKACDRLRRIVVT